MLTCHYEQQLYFGGAASYKHVNRSGFRLLTSYLLDLRIRDRYRLLALKLLHLVEDDSANVEVQTHTDRVRRDKNVKAILWLVEQLSLMPTHLWRQCAINHAAFMFGPPLDIRFDVEYVSPRERHNAVAWLDARILTPQSVRLNFQGCEAVVTDDCQRLSHVVAHLLNQRQGGGVAAEVDLICRQALKRPGPCPTSLIISNHLQQHQAQPDDHVTSNPRAACLQTALHSALTANNCHQSRMACLDVVMLALASLATSDMHYSITQYLQNLFSYGAEWRGRSFKADPPHLYFINHRTVPLLGSADHLNGT